MTKLLRTLSLILIILMLFTIVACNTTDDPIDPDGGNMGDNGGSGVTDGGNTGDNGGSGGNTDVDIKLPDMEIPEGYNVLSSKELTLPVSKGGELTGHKARLAAIKKAENGLNALYLDILSNENTILTTKVWYGYYQLYLGENGMFTLLSLSANSQTQLANINYTYYDISYGQDDSIQINKYLAGTRSSLSFNHTRPKEANPDSGTYDFLIVKFQAIFEEGPTAHLLADCFFDPSAPKLYSDAEKQPVPDFKSSEIREKYSFENILKLCNSSVTSGNTGDNGGSGGNTDVGATLPDMEIPEGYTVLSSKELTLPVTQKEQTTDHKARIAAIKTENGENALYLDVISNENTILTTKVLNGYYQLFVADNGVLFLVKLSVTDSQFGKQARLEYGYYEISDYDWEKLETTPNENPKFKHLYSSPISWQSFYFDSPMQLDNARGKCESLCANLRNELKQISSYYMLADNISDTTAPKLYTQDDKIPAPDATNASEMFKYQFDSFVELARKTS